jgi:hypothetical protein
MPEDAQPEYGEVEIPAYALAYVETDAGRPGGGGFSAVYAVPTTEATFASSSPMTTRCRSNHRSSAWGRCQR